MSIDAASSQTLPDIIVSAVAIIRDRRVLMVTARGRDVVFMPGGKVDAGETLLEAAQRESREEISVGLISDTVRELFTVVTQAHGEPEGRMVRMTLFAGIPDAEPQPAAEVSALHWISSAELHRCPPAGAEVVRRLAASGLID
ncbi:NUDIX hydrolase [Paramicrobacterium agarici]|uniref:ADP-ribose pyrophosphatase YjhB (NUDIX family) n=1 Tax=Paramicrobacterium agarici TaxID=630514 RepID=A0A2A9DUA3_9MICO|nr:NUDIX domain-containing protein [Microbacterium agarici]PFG29500.1 ADP-ribose pyrophosphatase YjhB (NUDIX family) [Microbacterium agarici]